MMPIDPTIKATMLTLPELFQQYTGVIIRDHERLRDARRNAEIWRTGIVATLIPEWNTTKSNEQVRNGQVAALLAADDVYQECEDVAKECEESIKAAQMHLDELRFQSAILIAIANNDGRE